MTSPVCPDKLPTDDVTCFIGFMGKRAMVGLCAQFHKNLPCVMDFYNVPVFLDISKLLLILQVTFIVMLLRLFIM